MIQANELRVGNWLRYEDTNSYSQVLEIYQSKGDELIFTSGSGATYRSMNGISITPEILEKAGFEWSIWHQAYWLKGFDWCLVSKGDKYTIQKSRRGGLTLCEVQYLHYLQNIYYLLTNQELTIQL